MQRNSLKVFLCTFLAVIMILPSGALAADGASGKHWAAPTLQQWEEQELLAPGYNPDQKMTRLDFVALLNHILGLHEQQGNTFIDVAPEIAGIVDIAATAGYIKGYGDGSFKPEQPITREEVAVILSRIFSITASNSQTGLKDDDQLKSWSKASIHGLVSEGYLNGYPDGQFKPQRGITLAELVTMLNNIADVIITKPGTYHDLSAKNIIIAAPNVTITGSDIERSVYITQGAVGGQVTIEDSRIGRRLFSKLAADAVTTTNISFGNGETPTATPTPTPEPTPAESEAPATTPAPTKKPSPTPSSTPSSTPSGEPSSTPSSEPPSFDEVSVHDPAIVRSEDVYYVFGSHGDAAVSDDLISWQAIGNGYATSGNVLYGELADNLSESFAWAGQDDADSKGGFAVWAPDVIWVPEFVNEDGSEGAYLLYYSVSSTYIRSAIGVAASKTIEGPFQYVDTIVYSGFTNKHEQDNNSNVDKHWENTNITQLIEDKVFDDARSGWFTSNGSYNNTMFPNAIDANLYRDSDNKLWMNYGSWSGGIFVLEIDPQTGTAIYPGKDGTTADDRMIDRYFGTKISGGYAKSGEGPYIIYDEETEYFYLFVTYGWLGIDGEYNMRVFRSESPTGPFLDSAGQSAVLPSTAASNAPYGNKLMGHYSFDRYVGEPGSGNGIQYVSPGHNSVLFDEDGKRYVVFHTRFSQSVDGHQLRIHQLIMNEDGWLVATPYRYSGETLSAVSAADIAGDYRYINHGKDSSTTVHHSQFITLEADGTIHGAVSGEWKLVNDYDAVITIDGEQHKGAFLQQWDAASQAYVMVFTALSDQGITIWGSKLEVELSIGEDIYNDLSLDNTELATSNLNLPAVATRGVEIQWSSSHPDIISDQGVVTRNYSNDDPEPVTMTASFTVDGQTYEKSFEVTVKPIPVAVLKAQYSFEGDLLDTLDESKVGTVVGNRIDAPATSDAAYEAGISGEALYLDGATGIVLPNDLIDSYNYSVAMWLKPDELNSFTTALFGANDVDHWISVLPGGNAVADTQLWHRNATNNVWLDAKGKGKLAVGDWTHVAFTVEEGLINMYINGQLTYTGRTIADLFSDGDSIFSIAVNYWDTPYKGYMDELLVYDGILTQAEITDLLSSSVAVTDIYNPLTSKIISLGESYTPQSISALPGLASDPTLLWSSSDEEIAMVDELTGTVTPLAEGEATITATSQSNPAISSSYTLYVVDGPIAYYDFNADLGNKAVADLEAGKYVGNLLHIATSDAPVFESFNDGISEYTGLVLDGNHGVVLPNHYFSDQTYTISLRAKLDSFTGYSTLLFAEEAPNNWISVVPGGFDSNMDRLMLWSQSSGQWFDGITDTKLDPDTWYTISIVVDGSNVKLYVDGELSGEYDTMPQLFNSDTATIAIAVNFWDIPSKGMLDELYIFDYALGEDELAGLHQ